MSRVVTWPPATRVPGPGRAVRRGVVRLPPPNTHVYGDDTDIWHEGGAQAAGAVAGVDRTYNTTHHTAQQPARDLPGPAATAHGAGTFLFFGVFVGIAPTSDRINSKTQMLA